MEIQIKKCGSCGVPTNKGKYWGTGTWLCDKCHNEWKEKDRKMREDDFSVSESVIKKVRKGKSKRNKKARVVTKLHDSGSQSRLTMFNEE